MIDRDYRGVVQVLLYNAGTASYLVRRGDRIAQGIVERILRPRVIEVSGVMTTSRGACGFGSTD